MHRGKRSLWKNSIAIAGLLLLFMFLVGVPVSVANASAGVLALATPGTVTVQATPTVDATVTALTKEQLQHTNDWWWNYGATILTSLISTLTLAAAGVFTVVRYFNDRRDTREKQEAEAKRLAEERKIERERREEEQQHRLKDQEAEREKRAEERFQAVVERLSSEREEAKIGAAITLRTFLRPGYEQFYIQTFDLAAAHLRIPRGFIPPDGDPDTPLPLTTLSQVLIVIFREAFPLARSQSKGSPQSLDASGIQLDNAFLNGTDLKQVWIRQASLRKAKLRGANLSGASLLETNFSGAKLRGANLSEADLIRSDLSGAEFIETNFSGAKLRDANLSGADLSGANLHNANLTKANIEAALSLKNTDLRGAKGLTTEQLTTCKRRGAIIDEAHTTQSSEAIIAVSPSSQSTPMQASSALSVQKDTPDGSNVVSPQLPSEP